MTGPAPIELTKPRCSPGLVARAAERFRLWRRHRRRLREIGDASTLGGLDRILDDFGVTHAEMEVLLEAPAGAGDEFETLARKAGIDLRQLSPAVLREASWVCSRCECRVPCRRWLRTGVWRGGGDMRCPNAALFRC